MYEQLFRFFFIGFGVGIGVVLVKWAWSLTRFRPEPPPALLIAIGFWIALSIIRDVSYFVWIATIVLAWSGWVSERFRKHQLTVRILLIAIGAALLVLPGYETQDLFLQLLLLASILVFSGAILVFEKSYDRNRWIPLMLFASAGGIVVTVPDTEGPLLVFGILTAALLFVWKSSPSFFGASGMASFAGMLMWMIFEAGKGRPASIIVAIGCLGIMIVIPLLIKSFPNLRWKFSNFLWLPVHCLSIATVVGFVRTTPSISRATITASVALLIPLIVGILTSKIRMR